MAELGLSLAESDPRGRFTPQLRRRQPEEDIFNLVAHDYYRRLPHYRELSAEDEEALMVRHLYRVTDTCIPEEEAVRPLEKALLNEWQRSEEKGKSDFPHEFLYRILLAGTLKDYYQIDPRDSWVLAAAQKDLADVCSWLEDSTLGNTREPRHQKEIKNVHTVRTGIEYMVELADWYQATCREHSMFFQIGGGIAGDFHLRSAHARTEPEKSCSPLG
jgi:deoxyhypusine synthase